MIVFFPITSVTMRCWNVARWMKRSCKEDGQTCLSVPFSKRAAVQVLHNNLGNRGPHKGSSALQENLGILWWKPPMQIPLPIQSVTILSSNLLSFWSNSAEKQRHVTKLLVFFLQVYIKFIQMLKISSHDHVGSPKSLIFLVDQSPKKHPKSASQSRDWRCWMNSRPSWHQNVWRYKASGI